MSVIELLSEMKRRGISLTTDGEALWLHPSSAVTLELVQQTTLHKQYLLALLERREERSAIQWEASATEDELSVALHIAIEELCELTGLRLEPANCPVCQGDLNETEFHHPCCDPCATVYYCKHWIALADYHYIMTPTPNEPCPWCGGRNGHNPNCVVLCDEWADKMPFGRHTGKPVRDLDRSYLAWLLVSGLQLGDELRQVIETVLNCED